MSQWNLSVRLTGQGSSLSRTLRDTSRDARSASRDVQALTRDIGRLRAAAARDIRLGVRIDARSLRAEVQRAVTAASAGQSLRIRLGVDSRFLRADVRRAVATARTGQDLRVRLGVDARYLRADAQRAITAARSGQSGLDVNLRLGNAMQLRREVEDAVRWAAWGHRIEIPIGLADPMQLRRDVTAAVRWAQDNQRIRIRVDADTSALTGLGRTLGGGSGGGGLGLGLGSLIPVATAVVPLIAGLAANLAPIAGMFSAAAVGATAFGLAVGGQAEELGEVADAEKEYQEAVRDHGRGSLEAAQAQLAYQQRLAALPPETQRAAMAVSSLKTEFQDWSDEMSGFTMVPVTKGAAILQELLPRLSPEVHSFSGHLDRLMDVAGGSISTPGFDTISDRVAEFTDARLDSFTDQLIHLLRVASEGSADSGALGQIIDYVRENGPEARQALEQMGDAIGTLAAGAAEAGPTMLTLVTAVASLVAALPPEAVAIALQLAAALKLVQLAGLGAAAVSAGVTRLSTAVAALGATSAAAGGGIAGLRAAVASLSAGARFGAAAAGVLALVFALHELSDNKPAVQVDELSTSLNTLISTGETTGVLSTNLDEMAASIAMVSKGASDNKLAQWTSDFGTWIGIAEGPGISTARENVDAWDKSMANLVKSGNPEQAAEQYELLKKAWQAGGGDLERLKTVTNDYDNALADAAFEQEMAAQSMGIFAQSTVDTAAKLDAQKQSADGLRASIIALNEANRSAYDAQIGFEQAMDDLTAAFKENGATLDLNTEAGRKNGQAMSAAAKSQDEMIAAGLAAGESLGSMVGKSEQLRESMLRLATEAFDGNKKKATEYVNTLLGTPGEIKTLVRLEREDAIRGLLSVQAEIAATPNAHTVTVDTLNAAAIAALEAVGLKTRQLPDGRTQVFTANGTALGNIDAVRAALDRLDGKTANTSITTTRTTIYRNVQRGGGSNQAAKNAVETTRADGAVVDYYANGGIRAGRVTRFADGSENHVAEIAPAGDWRVWAEPETGGEAYIPLALSKRGRSRAITEETVRRLGGDPAAIQWNADGNITDWRYDPSTGSLYSPTDAGAAGRKTKKVKGKEVEYFDLGAVERKLKSASKATRAWNADLEKVADRVGGDVAEALASMGEEGVKLADKMARGSTKYINEMAAALRGLQATAKASLTDYTRQLGTANKMNSTFANNLAKLAGQGYGDLAAQLAEQNDEAAQQLAAAAVRDKGKAAKANSAAKTANNALTDDQVQDLVQIIAAIRTKSTGIHTVAGTTGLGEDVIIDVANKAKGQIASALGSRAERFLADLAKANKGMAYADGGIRAGMYATRGGIIRFAEPETGGEAFLPLSPSKRRTALPVLRDVASRFGLGLTDARATRPVVIVRGEGDTNVSVTAVRTGASASDIGAQVGRSVRRARRGGVAARAA